jgi:hypothetical protein
MTREEAIAKANAAVEALPSGPKRTGARKALHRLLREVEAGHRSDVAEARRELLAAVPGLRSAIDRIIAERFTAPTPLPRMRKRRL